jgi:hydroxymethylpyrimidine kinase / phosphomethylpyrimidine kinase / thiamine-phosphate diphosphorylase
VSRRVAPVAFPVALTIAGSDSGGGAGVQADLKTMEAHGVFGTSAITAVTAQNTRGVHSSYVLPVPEIEAQIEAVLSDFDVGAVKTGMLATVDVIECVATALSDREVPTVVDPVMVAATGDRLLESQAEAAYEALFAETTLVTPNADEAAVLTGVEPTDEKSAVDAGDALLAMGADAVLVKGGHMPTEDVLDVLVTEGEIETYRHARIDTEATHGSGCTLAAATAARLAKGESLSEAVSGALAFMERAVRYPIDVGSGPGSVHHLVSLRDRAEREATVEAMSALRDRLESGTVLDVVGATPYAESRRAIAVASVGRGRSEHAEIRFDATSPTASLLLAAREGDPALRFGIGVREDTLDAVGPVVEVESSETPERSLREAVDGTDRTVAVVDRTEGRAAVLASDPEALVEFARRLPE